MDSTYTTIDGDISDFIDAASAAMDVFKTEDLREFLLKEGPSLPEAIASILSGRSSNSMRRERPP